MFNHEQLLQEDRESLSSIRINPNKTEADIVEQVRRIATKLGERATKLSTHRTRPNNGHMSGGVTDSYQFGGPNSWMTSRRVSTRRTAMEIKKKEYAKDNGRCFEFIEGSDSGDSVVELSFYARLAEDKGVSEEKAVHRSQTITLNDRGIETKDKVVIHRFNEKGWLSGGNTLTIEVDQPTAIRMAAANLAIVRSGVALQEIADAESFTPIPDTTSLPPELVQEISGKFSGSDFTSSYVGPRQGF